MYEEIIQQIQYGISALMILVAVLILMIWWKLDAILEELKKK